MKKFTFKHVNDFADLCIKFLKTRFYALVKIGKRTIIVTNTIIYIIHRHGISKIYDYCVLMFKIFSIFLLKNNLFCFTKSFVNFNQYANRCIQNFYNKIKIL